MWRRFWLASLLILVPGVARAQYAPERFLPAGSQIYLSWDGIDKHRAAFDKTGLGKMLKEDTGKFLAALWTYGNDLMDVALRQADPNAVALIKEIPPILSSVHHHGFVLGIEVKALNPPEVNAVIVFPKAASSKLVPLIEKVAGLAHAEIKKASAGSRTVYQISQGPVHFGWWKENADVVLVVGTTPPAAVAGAADSSSGVFTQSKTYGTMTQFKEFPTWVRGHLEIGGLLQKVGELAPQADQIIDHLGLKGLHGITFHSGFAGTAERSIVEIDAPSPRKGLLSLLSQKNIKLADLPPLPSDATSFSASNFNLRSFYDGGVMIAEAAVNAFAGGAVDPKEAIRQAEALLGVKFGEDLFGSFDDMFVSYSSPAEGPFGLGGVYLFKVKDEKKLGESLDGLLRSIPPFPGAEVSYKKSPYHGGELMELKLKTDQAEFALANMTIHKGWFMLASYPQSIYGFILRNNGALPSWKASAKLTKSLVDYPKEFTAISVSDPRPTVQAVLSFAPTLMTLANTVLPNVLPGAPMFDVSVIPHAQDAVRHLFPNITISTDDGKKIRSDTRASLALPF